MPRTGALILKEWNDYIRRVSEELPDLAQAAAEEAMAVALEWVLANLPARPTRESAKAQWPGFQTDKQRRWFFWALHSGELARLRAQAKPLYPDFYSEAKIVDGRVVGIIANDRPWAPWVIGPDYPGTAYPGLNQGKPMYQARIHAGRWWQLGEFMTENAAEIWRVFFEDFESLFKELGV